MVAALLLCSLLPGSARAREHPTLTGDVEIPTRILEQPLEWQSLDPAATVEGPQLDSAVASTRAEEAWPATRGEDAVVALIDTGVAAIPALQGAVAGEIDFSGSGGGDGYGHGTFMASLIAGRGPVAPGVAPAAGVLSLKVADAEGHTDLGTVLGAMEWLAGPGRGLGIKVAVMALGTEPDSAAGEILDIATERLANLGVLVITSSGNAGPGNLTSPATSPATISVGAVDDQGTALRGDDMPTKFSADGPDRTGTDQPDVVASGVRVVGAIGSDSLIAEQNPQAMVADGLFRGSGTSMSTALAGGVAALMADVRPDLGGRELAAALTASHELDAPAALAAANALPAGRDTMLRPETATAFAEAVTGLTTAHADAMAAIEDERQEDRAAAQQRAAAKPEKKSGTSRAAVSDDALQRQLEIIDERAAKASQRVTKRAEQDLNRLERHMLDDLVPAPSTAGWNPAVWDSVNWGAADWAVQRWVAHDWTPIARDSVGWDALLAGVYGLHSVHWGSVNWGSVNWGSVNWGAEHWDAANWTAQQWESVHWGSVRWGADAWESVRWGSVNWGSVNWGADEWAAAHWATAGWNSVNWGSVNWGSVNWGDAGWTSVRWGALTDPTATAWDSVRWGADAWESVRWGSINWGSVNWGSVNWGALAWDPPAV